MMLDYKALGKRLKEQRLKKGKTQEQLGELAGLSTVHVSHIECGTAKLSLETLLNLCAVLDTTPDMLLFDSVYTSKERLKEEIALLLNECSEKNMNLIVELIKTVNHVQKD